MRQVEVALGERSYRICVGPGLLDDAGSLVASLGTVERIVVVTNAAVRSLYGAALENSLKEAGLTVEAVIEIADGERFKTLATVEKVYDGLLDLGGDRSVAVVALGGGVVGDVAGFAAATALRGLKLLMVPTTLLAQVDSSVGGKTGVNRPQGKNLVGVFYQPSLVIADVATLTSLSEREYRAGLAEVVKYGVILDAPLFETLEAESARIEQRDGVLMAEIVARCSALKASVVERDEKESSGYRAVLNFGHTVGHGLENLTGYGSYLHGEAVAVGMAAAARVSASLGECDPGVAGRIEGLLAVLGLDCRMPTGLDRDELARAIAFDKKVSGGEVGFVVCTGVGGCRLRKMSPTDIASAV